MRLWGSWEWVRKATKMSDSAAFEKEAIPTAKKLQIKTEKLTLTNDGLELLNLIGWQVTETKFFWFFTLL